jgi:hypothetical protein
MLVMGGNGTPKPSQASHYLRWVPIIHDHWGGGLNKKDCSVAQPLVYEKVTWLNATKFVLTRPLRALTQRWKEVRDKFLVAAPDELGVGSFVWWLKVLGQARGGGGIGHGCRKGVGLKVDVEGPHLGVQGSTISPCRRLKEQSQAPCVPYVPCVPCVTPA